MRQQRAAVGLLGSSGSSSCYLNSRAGRYPIQATRHVFRSSWFGSPTAETESNPDEVSAVVTGEWLSKNIDKVKILDGSWSPKRKKGQPWQVQIPGARFFDIDEIADQKTWLPHMLPTVEEFEAKVTELGVQNKDHIVIYDHSNGQFVASARVWWTFRVFGHSKVSVLAQGFEGWPNGLSIPPEDPNKKKEPFKAQSKDSNLVWDWSKVLLNVDPNAGGPKTHTILDARSAERFYAKVDEPREDVPRGSIPSALNIPFMSLFKPEKRPSRTGAGEVEVFSLKEKNELWDHVRQVIVPDQSVAAYCGTGVTACVLALALHTLGNKVVPVYDGSWTEWGLKKNTPKVLLRIDTKGRLENWKPTKEDLQQQE